jgi:hypothetical protein
MVKFGVLFEVQTEFLNVIKTSFGFKGLKSHREGRILVGSCHTILVRI